MDDIHALLGMLSGNRVNRAESEVAAAQSALLEAAFEARVRERQAQQAQARRKQMASQHFEDMRRELLDGALLQDRQRSRSEASRAVEDAQSEVLVAQRDEAAREEQSHRARILWLAALARRKALMDWLEDRTRAEDSAREARLELIADDDGNQRQAARRARYALAVARGR
jgi:replicative superfamily II helicase